jgi:putative inorganic carbon (hco3(-)) transporter
MHTVSSQDKTALSDANNKGGIALWMVLFFTFILYISPQSYFPFLKSIHLAKTSAILALTAFFFVRKNQSIRIAIPEKYVLALCALTLCSIPFSAWKGGSFGFFIDIFSKVLIIYFLMSRVLVSEQQIRTMFTLLVFCNVFFAIVGLWHYAHGIYLKGDRIGGPIGGIAYDPNDLALSLLTTLPLALCLAKLNSSSFKKALYWIFAGLMASGIIVSFSRGGFLGLCMVVFILFRNTFRQKMLLVIIFCLLVLPVVVSLLPDAYFARLITIVDIEKDPTSSASTRYNDMHASIIAAMKHPVFGVGLGMTALALKEVQGDSARGGVHSAPLQIASELGLPALFVYIGLIVVLLKKLSWLMKVASKDPSYSSLHAIAMALHAAIWGFIVSGFFLPVAYRWYFFYLAGMATALFRINHLLSENIKD